MPGLLREGKQSCAAYNLEDGCEVSSVAVRNRRYPYRTAFQQVIWMRAAMAQWPISRKGNRMAETIGKALARARADADRRKIGKALAEARADADHQKLESTARNTSLDTPSVEDILDNVERINATTQPKKRKNGRWMFFRKPKL